jgi:hypothetical protein
VLRGQEPAVEVGCPIATFFAGAFKVALIVSPPGRQVVRERDIDPVHGPAIVLQHLTDRRPRNQLSQIGSDIPRLACI